MPSVEVSRESLYELVWTEPMTTVARRFGVSDVAVIKACRKLDVPRPPRGYWAQKQNGYRVPDPPPLRVLTGGDQTHVFSQPEHRRPVWSKGLAEPIAFPSNARTHAKLLTLKAKVTERRPDRYGRIGDEKNINVSKKELPRAVRILSALFATLEKRGGSVTVEGDRLTVSVRGERMAVMAYEVANRVKVIERGYEHWDYQPSGNLMLKARSVDCYRIRREWSDGKSTPLEEKLGEIVGDLEVAPALIAAERAADEARERRWRREALVQRRAESLVALLRKRASKVGRLAADYDRAIQIRSLIAAIENTANAPTTSRRLARWARQYADHLDPLVAFRIPELEADSRRNPHDSSVD